MNSPKMADLARKKDPRLVRLAALRTYQKLSPKPARWSRPSSCGTPTRNWRAVGRTGAESGTAKPLRTA